MSGHLFNMTGLLNNDGTFRRHRTSISKTQSGNNHRSISWSCGQLAWIWVITFFGGTLFSYISVGERISLATFNVENYILESNQGRNAKSIASRQAVKNSLLSLQADVVALQEIGSVNALLELRNGLELESLSYPYHAISETPGSPIHVALLSRFPIKHVAHHTTNVFVLYGKAFRPSRGFLEVDVVIPKSESLKIFVAHLKSKRSVGYADQWDLRTREALLLRSLVDARLKKDPEQLLAVVGDFNDGPVSQTLKFLRGGKGKMRFADARPSEGIPMNLQRPDLISGKRASVWTHFFQDEDIYSRVDFILMNRALNQYYRDNKSCVLNLPNWGQASDHRPVLAVFEIP